ncbi:rhotekin-2-like isoform X2 [Oppia nitens]|uniref:rhotekin-2-like isoform X2 n=1 Tax=Oppia nitens TaxID=1686743 RepID=UPI0023D9F85D|nr:rhotekin-2-like isoform X2 [Oppia nitens]
MQRYIYAIWEKKTCFCFVDTREYDLEQKIDLEIKMREGTTKLLAACKHSNQTLEAAKSLLTSNERMIAYMSELQRRRAAERQLNKVDLKMKYLNPKGDGGKAKVSVSDIRMPLIWKDSDHFKNKGDYRRFAVFCLLKIGTEIYDTIMVTNVDRSTTDIQFDDICVFQNIPPDFEFRLEVYSRVLHEDLSIASTPRKLSKKISTSVSKTLGRKLAAAVKDDMDSETGPKFHLVATATLRLKDASDAIKTHDLVIENLENRHWQLPLFGHFCCRLAVQPDCQNIERIAGYLKVKEASIRAQKIESIYWASLKNFQLKLWSKKYDRNSSSSYGSNKKRFDGVDADVVIPITNRTKVNCGSNALTISSDDKCYVMLNDNGMSDVRLWAKHLEQTIQDFAVWESVAEYHMPIPSPSPTRAPMYLKNRIPGSLYDETPIQDPQTPNYKSNGTLPRRVSHGDSLRSRSSSLSSSCTNSSSVTSSGKHSSQASPTQTYTDHQMDCKHNFLFFQTSTPRKPLMNY